MGLLPFLRNRRPVPRGRWRLAHRHAEGGPWTEVARVTTLEAARDERHAGAGTWPVAASPGDLVRLSGRGAPRDFGIADDGSIRPLRALPWHEYNEAEGYPSALRWARGRPWLDAWEACPRGDWLLLALTPLLPRVVLVRAALACARRVHEGLIESPRALGRVVEAVEAWTRAPASAQADLAARVRERRAEATALPWWEPPSEEAKHARDAILVLGDSVSSTGWVDVVAGCAAGGEEATPEAHRIMADLVRHQVPLADVVRACAGGAALLLDAG